MEETVAKNRYEDELNELKTRYQNYQVSALVGAGFSKNAYCQFPSWDELLYDMVKELYQSEIDNGFHRQIHFSHLPRTCYNEYCNKKVQEIINREGYLDIVSQYIEKKGFREAAEVYIEERIPFVDEEKSTLSIRKNSKVIPLKDKDFETHAKLLEGAWNNIYTTNYDRLLEFTAKRKGKNWNVINKARELSFSKQAKSIIKLHGDFSEDSHFEFDGNCYHRYIISKDDYINYPKDHEAFTQLMRISLLQGTFCLFGFSGNDPNFISWIRWVRDILVMQRSNSDNTSATERIKIFLVDMTAERPSAEKQLFYNNHNICHIPLLSEDVRRIINASDITSPQKLIVKFLSYLYYNDDLPAVTIKFKTQYQKLWATIYSERTAHKNKEEWLKNILESISQLKPSNRIVKYTRKQELFLADIYRQSEFNPTEARLVLYALKDTYFLPQYYPFLIEKLDKIDFTLEERETYTLLKERGLTLDSPFTPIEKRNDGYIYEQILRYAFSLDFIHLKQLLFEWEPQNIFRVKKALFLSLFDKEQAINILTKYIDEDIQIKEKYYATELLNIIDWRSPSRYSVVKYENQNIDGLLDFTDSFSRNALRENKKLKPYGYQGEEHLLNKDNSDYEKALRFLQFLIESPFFVGINIGLSIGTIDAQKWYAIAKRLFEEFPYPVLFYSLQCQSADVIKRIGQEYAYSDKLLEQKDTSKILKLLLSAYTNEFTPQSLQINILTIAKELFVAVKPCIWEESFMVIWNNIVTPHYEEISRYTELFKFACQALRCVHSNEYKAQIVITCLTEEKKNTESTIDFLYHLNLRRNSIAATQKLQMAIGQFISAINDPMEFIIAGNIFPLLDKKTCQNISLKIRNIIKGNKIPPRCLKPIAYFAKQTKNNQTVVKLAIINNKKLWNNGIKGTNATAPIEYIELSEIKNLIKWTGSEIKSIYDKLKTSFKQLIENRCYNEEFDFFPLDYRGLLEEMFLFLTDHEKDLIKVEDYQMILQQVDSERKRKRGFVNVNEALISDDPKDVGNGLYQLSIDIANSSIEQHDLSINLLLDRILFKRKEGLTSCLGHMVYYLKRYYKTLPSFVMEKLLLITQIYTKDTLQELDLEIPVAVKYLIDIAGILSKAGCKSNSIQYWLRLKRQHRFNIL